MRLAIVVALGALAACQDSDVSRAVGARCDRTADCDDRCLTPSDDWPGGFCTVDCDNDDDCPSDTACVREDGGGICAYPCEAASELSCAFLGEGYECKERDAQPESLGKVNVCRG